MSVGGNNVELKATVTSDSSQAQQDQKKLGETFKDTGEQAQGAGSKFKEFAERIGKMNPKELASQILSIEEGFSHLGDAVDAVAKGDIPKFESSMSSAMRGVTGLVALVAPEFAPIVAALSPIVTKTLEWATGMKDAADAQKRLNEQLEFQNTLLERTAKIREIEATSPAQRMKIELDALHTLVDAKQKALEQQEELDKKGWFFGNEEAIKKAKDELLEARQQFSEKLAEIQKQENEDAEKAEKEREAVHQKHVDELTKQDDKWAHDSVANSMLAANGLKDWLDTAQGVYKGYAGAALAGAKASADADKSISASAKATSDAQKKAAEDARQKVVNSYQTMFSILTKATTDWKGAMGQLWDILTKSIIDNLTKQLGATTAFGGAMASAQASQASTTVATNAIKDQANLTTMKSGVLSWAGFLGPFGVAIAAAAIAAFMGLFRKAIGFEEGGPVRDRVPGLGRQDTVGGQLGADEGVLTGKGMATTLGEILGAVNRGGLQGAPALAGAGGGNFKLEISLADVPSDSELVRWIMGKINFRVLNQNGELVSSHYHTRNGRKL